MRARLTEYRDTLRAHVTSARRLQRDLLVKRAVLTTETGAGGRYVTLTAELSLGRVSAVCSFQS
jgi:hypothetical protein